jgi:hypothetical protein
MDGLTKMQKNHPIAKAVAIPLPTRAAPFTLIGVMAVSICAALAASQLVVFASTL